MLQHGGLSWFGGLIMGSRGERHLAEYLRGALKRQTFLPRLGFTYRGFEDYVLDRGCPYGSSSPLTPEELNAVLSVAGGRRWRIKECFHNAQMLAAMDISGRLKYVEGYAIGHLVPVLHAVLAAPYVCPEAAFV